MPRSSLGLREAGPVPARRRADPGDDGRGTANIDVYIDDGRHGEYPYKEVFWENQDIWNRLAADAGLTHQTPIVGRPNFLYVKVKNRGTQTATNVTVRVLPCRPETGLVWPADWVATTTPELPVGAPIGPGGTVLVGPFEWTPTVVGHECLLATATHRTT